MYLDIKEDSDKSPTGLPPKSPGAIETTIERSKLTINRPKRKRAPSTLQRRANAVSQFL